MQPLNTNSFPEWAKSATLYEVNLRQYTPGGTFEEFRNHLPRLKSLGVSILWFMPVQPIGIINRKGTLGSYYSIADYCSINTEFGTLATFKELVEEIHSMGMSVLLDWVANHTAWDHVWVYRHPEFYCRDENGSIHPPFPEWEDVVKLDYTNNKLREEMIRSMKFWLHETGIDGFRCDMAHLVPTEFWEEASHELRKTKTSLFMLAESDQYELLHKAFHSSYDWKTYHAMNELAGGKITSHDLIETIREQFKYYPEHASLLRFITNHDENSWQGSELERLGLMLEPMTVLYFTLPGIPLIYSGQEAGNPVRLPFFDKSVIQWKEDKMHTLLLKLIELRNRCKCLWSSSFGGTLQFHSVTGECEGVVAFSREKEDSHVLVILNFSATIRHATAKFERLYTGITDMMNPSIKITLGADPCFELQPFSYRVLYT